MRAGVASLYREYVKTDLPLEEIEGHVDEYAARTRTLDPVNALAVAAPANFRMNPTMALAARYDLGDIIADLEKAVGLDPRDSSVRNWLGLAYLTVGAKERGLETFTARAELDPLFGPCAENLYDVLVTLERYDGAWTHLTVSNAGEAVIRIDCPARTRRALSSMVMPMRVTCTLLLRASCRR